ncbi:MAG: bifunctional precorrin-2 dehydrogenase/sirohydrochlorin ferrochelatase [Chloroflexi bacterium]|nr:bifunctional precorrin-2 dehydrogenase/sirohydrochlorin ferrochelatase [Chloroflexota bacterium]
MSYYPLFLKVNGKRCVVVGGGEVAERKTLALAQCGAVVRVISPTLCPDLEGLVQDGLVEISRRLYRYGDLEGASMAIAATDSPQTNEKVAKEAQDRGILINVVDDPEHCDFIVPSVVRKGDLVIAISTGGRSPALAKRLRRELEETLAPAYATLLTLVAEVREELKAKRRHIPSSLWQEALNNELLDLIQQGNLDAAKSKLKASLEKEVLT